MKNEKDNVTPLFINGEYNDRLKKQRPSNNNEKLPTKRYGFSDFLLTLIGLALVGYGIYMYMNKDESKKENSNSNSTVTEKKSNKTSNKNEKKKIELDYEKLVSFSEINEKNLFSNEDSKLLLTGLEASQMSNNLKLALAARISDKQLFENGANAYILDDELDSKMNLIFGNINYEKSAFSYGNTTFTYNQETKRFYLFDNTEKIKLSYRRYNYVTKETVENKLILKNYVAYTLLDNSVSSTLNNTRLTTVITDENIKNQINNLKYYEYEFALEDGSYHLKKITIK